MDTKTKETEETKKIYTRDFRLSLLKLLVESRQKFEFLGKYIKEEYFEADLAMIYKMIKKIYINNEDINNIKKDILLNELLEYAQNIAFDRSTCVMVTKTIYLKEISNNESAITSRAIEWIKKERLISSLYKVASMVKESSNLDKVKSIVDDALDVSNYQTSYSTLESLSDIPDKINEERGEDKLVKTGFKELDNYMEGGLGIGEVHVILGSAKGGKTSFLVQLGKNALEQNKNVVHITLELSENIINWKYATCITGMTYDQVKRATNNSPELRKEYLKRLSNFQQNINSSLFIKKFPAGKTDTIEIKAFINALIDDRKLIKPDLIVIDYDDLLVSSKKMQEKYYDIGQVYFDMVNLAETFSCPVLTASQVNRLGWSKQSMNEYLTSVEISHSALKRDNCNSIISLNDIDEHNAVLWLDTNRIGEMNVEVRIHKDLARCRFWDDYNEEGDTNIDNKVRINTESNPIVDGKSNNNVSNNKDEDDNDEYDFEF